MKSPPSRRSDAPHVHPRLRKRLARCTLDCGFKTPESPALRGFVAERCPITGTSLYLVLKSNGLHRPKIRLKKFGSSPKTVPANIAKKLPSQRCSKPLFIAFFNVSHKRPTFAFADENGYTEKDRTQRLTRRNRGLFPPSVTARLCAASEIFLFRHAFIYIHFPVLCEPSPSADGENLAKLPSQTLSQTVSHPAFQLRSQTPYVCFHRRKRVHTRLRQQDRTQGLTHRITGISDGGGITTLGPFCAVRKPCVAGYQNGKLCRFWVLVGRCSRRTQRAFGTAMRSCASLSRGVAAPLGCVILLFVR